MKKIIVLAVVVFFCLLVAGELVARYVLGLGNTPVYVSDANYEYIYKANQKVERFGKLTLTNEFSMRSLPLGKNENRVLIFGDSVLNGGALTDHEKLATTLLEKNLQKSCDTPMRVLNISAGSWGPDNAFAYLKKYGDFNATAIILFFSSHDAHDNMNHEKIVDIHPSYPSKEPCCALMDGFTRYLIPKVKSLFSKPNKEEFSKINKIDTNETFNTGWEDFVQYANQHNIKLYVVLHPDKKELETGKYDTNGQQIINFLNVNNIPYLLELGKTKQENFRDDIHYNEKGQEFLFHALVPVIEKNFCQIHSGKEL
jgi:lysophospholipase L1-like esterase